MKKMILRIWDNKDKVRARYYTPSGRRFISKVVPDSFLKATIKVVYGKKICSLGCFCEFSNEAEAFDKPTLLKIVRDFLEEE